MQSLLNLYSQPPNKTIKRVDPLFDFIISIFSDRVMRLIIYAHGRAWKRILGTIQSTQNVYSQHRDKTCNKKVVPLFDFEILIFANRVMRLVIGMEGKKSSYNTHPP